MTARFSQPARASHFGRLSRTARSNALHVAQLALRLVEFASHRLLHLRNTQRPGRHRGEGVQEWSIASSGGVCTSSTSLSCVLQVLCRGVQSHAACYAARCMAMSCAVIGQRASQGGGAIAQAASARTRTTADSSSDLATPLPSIFARFSGGLPLFSPKALSALCSCLTFLAATCAAQSAGATTSCRVPGEGMSAALLTFTCLPVYLLGPKSVIRYRSEGRIGVLRATRPSRCTTRGDCSRDSLGY